MANRIAPYTVGDVATLRGCRDGKLSVMAPDGLELAIPAANGKASVTLSQVGTWEYTWPDGDSGTLIVLANDDAQADPVGVVEPG